MGQTVGQLLNDAWAGHWSSDEYARIADLTWNVGDRLENPEATPYMRFIFDCSANAIANAAFAGVWAELGGPTMDIGWVPTNGKFPGQHFFWNVTTSEGSALYQVGYGGTSTAVTLEGTAARYAGYLGGNTAITGIPIFFPAGAAAEGIPAYNCLTGAWGALGRGLLP